MIFLGYKNVMRMRLLFARTFCLLFTWLNYPNGFNCNVLLITSGYQFVKSNAIAC